MKNIWLILLMLFSLHAHADEYMNKLLISTLGISNSPQAKVLFDMGKAICRNGGNLIAAKPFVTESSKAILDLGQAFMPLAQAMNGQKFNDELAKGCQNPFKILNEVKVNNGRYLIEYLEHTGERKEVAIVFENGWKVDLSGL